ncbi:hypothetical protein MLD38_027816 [Melastoma candidum]|uniref:Uncharacterized protein n=1 Tax=Melastoma candidum TaxID=119954 RepID=A0ACB9P3U5_9MYRT|nr:hypothetical protein MLD38_027816 [Melastoma candidum]
MDLLLVLLLFLLLAYSSYKFIAAWTTPNLASSNLPPGPKPLPLIGNILVLGELPHKSLHRLSQTYGPIIKLSLGHLTTVVISSSTLAKEALQTYDTSFPQRFIPDAVTVEGHDRLGLPWVPLSPLFRTLRRIYSMHLFSAKKLEATQDIRRESVRQLLSHVKECAREGKPVDVGEIAFTTTLNLLSNTVFSVDLVNGHSDSASGELKELVWNIMAVLGKPNMADYFPLLKRFDPHGSRRLMGLYCRKLTDLFERMIGERQKMRAENGRPRKNDVLDVLLDLCENQGEDGIDILLVKHIFLDVFTAGTDTTSSTLEWAMAELHRNPEKLQRAREELHQVIGKGQCVEESRIQSLPYLHAIVKETLRLHPPTPLLLPRKAVKDVRVGGNTIPGGAQVLVNAWAIGRDPKVWGEDTESFMPERFMGTEMDVKGHDDFGLIPFGGGRRICPGVSVSMRMLHAMLGTLLNNFDWEVVGEGGECLEEKFGITLHKAQPLKALPIPIPL